MTVRIPRKVKRGDIILPEDHNYKKYALLEILDILERKYYAYVG
jgi:hypothetical protein